MWHKLRLFSFSAAFLPRSNKFVSFAKIFKKPWMAELHRGGLQQGEYRLICCFFFDKFDYYLSDWTLLHFVRFRIQICCSTNQICLHALLVHYRELGPYAWKRYSILELRELQGLELQVHDIILRIAHKQFLHICFLPDSDSPEHHSQLFGSGFSGVCLPIHLLGNFHRFQRGQKDLPLHKTILLDCSIDPVLRNFHNSDVRDSHFWPG